MIGTEPVHELFFSVESFAAYAVVSLIFSEVDISGVVDLLENQSDCVDVVCICGPDEIIIVDGKLRPQAPELGADAVCIFLRGCVCSPRGLYDLVAVLIRTGQKKFLDSAGG